MLTEGRIKEKEIKSDLWPFRSSLPPFMTKLSHSVFKIGPVSLNFWEIIYFCFLFIFGKLVPFGFY
jgi:hypothetical protein